jgi:hypothetical protein
MASAHAAKDWPMTEEEIKLLIEQVREGLASARYAAKLLDWTVDEVCEVAFGEVVL